MLSKYAYHYFAFSAVFNCVASYFLAFLLLLKDKKNKVNIKLILFALSIGSWSLFYILWPIAKTRELTLLSFRLLHIPATFVPIAYFDFVVTWLRKTKKYKKLVKIFYFTSSFFAFFTFSKYFIADMKPMFGMRYWAVPGVLYHFYLLNFFFIFIYASYLLIKAYLKTKDQTKKKQLFFILLGIVLTIVGGSTNYFLWYGVPIPPYGNIFGASFVILTIYTIVRYRFLDFKLITSETVLLILNLILLFRLIISSNFTEMIINGILLLSTLFLSAILIKSVYNEIEKNKNILELVSILETINTKLKIFDRQKTEFLSIASHQLRTPLSIINGYISLIEEGTYGKVNNELLKVIKNLEMSNNRLINLVDNFLNISRIEQGRLKFGFIRFDLVELTKNVISELDGKINNSLINENRKFKKRRKIILKTTDKSVNIYADKDKIRHVIFNYIDNAIKYSENDIIVNIKKEKEKVSVSVIDHGVGFSKSDLSNLFQKFYRAKNVENSNVEGTGLGIYLCRKFIEHHHGKVWAFSKGVGMGSEFGFWLPLSN